MVDNIHVDITIDQVKNGVHLLEHQKPPKDSVSRLHIYTLHTGCVSLYTHVHTTPTTLTYIKVAALASVSLLDLVAEQIGKSHLLKKSVLLVKVSSLSSSPPRPPVPRGAGRRIGCVYFLSVSLMFVLFWHLIFHWGHKGVVSVRELEVRRGTNNGCI